MSIQEYSIYLSGKIQEVSGESLNELIHTCYEDNVDEFLDTFFKKELLNKFWYVKWKKNNTIDFKTLSLKVFKTSNDELIQILNIKDSTLSKIVRYCKSQIKKIEIQIILFIVIILLYYYICYKIEIFINMLYKSLQQ
jgi:hypothetical protein